MNISGMDASTSVINERVQIELEAMMEEYEEKKIMHERGRRDELKRMEQERAQEKKRLQETAQKDLEGVRTALERT